jgi:N-acyl-D-amino-acid deacylase
MSNDVNDSDPCCGPVRKSQDAAGPSRRQVLRSGAAVAGAAATISFAATPAAAAERSRPQDSDQGHFDILIVGGLVMDGSGKPGREADVGIKDGRIVEIGKLNRRKAARRLDARGKIVTPGFVDPHSHAADSGDGGLEVDDPARRAAPNLVTQGITTLVVNQDGRSTPITDFRRKLTEMGIGPNTIPLVGHGFVRRAAMGEDVERKATWSEVRRMRALVRKNMAEGAWGLSAGLEYAPGRWSVTSEVIECAKGVVPYGGFYQSHPRSEGLTPLWYWPSQDPPNPPNSLDGVAETIEIGKHSGARVIATHIKTKAPSWGLHDKLITMMEEARERKIDAWADQYPYNTTGTDGNVVLIPSWVFDGDVTDHAATLREALADPRTAEDIRLDIQHEINRRGGPENVVALVYPNPDVVGKSLAQLCEARGQSPIEMAITLQYEGDRTRPGGGRFRGFSLHEDDIEPLMDQPWTMTGTDGGIALPEDGPGTNPRFYGSYPRKLRHYVMDRKVISFEQAIYTMTGLPAAVLKLRDRGRLLTGYRADVVVIDPDRVRDHSTALDPHRYSEGMEYVLINGSFVVDEDERTGALPGRILDPRRDRRRWG